MSVTKKHILVVEDERHLAIGIRYNLEAEGYRVTTVADGPAALRALESDADDRIDLMVLDLMLPGMSGYTVCETLRSHGDDRPVLILSARTLSEDRTRGFDVGADQYLIKPFELDELLSRVRNLIAMYERRVRRRTESASEQGDFVFGRAQVNFRTYQASVDGKPVRLTQLELKLLQYFVENEGRVIPRHELLENVWGTSGDISTRAVDQFILRLRKAFEPNPSEPCHFLTIRDAGYRFLSQATEEEDGDEK